MMSPSDELESRKQPEPMPPCWNCEHEYHRGRCTEEASNMGNPYALTDIAMCQCFWYEPMTAEDILADEHPETL